METIPQISHVSYIQICPIPTPVGFITSLNRRLTGRQYVLNGATATETAWRIPGIRQSEQQSHRSATSENHPGLLGSSKTTVPSRGCWATVFTTCLAIHVYGALSAAMTQFPRSHASAMPNLHIPNGTQARKSYLYSISGILTEKMKKCQPPMTVIPFP